MPRDQQHKIQHDQRVPRHDHHHQQVQSLQFPPVLFCAGAGGGVRAIPRQQDRRSGRSPMPITPGRVDPRRRCRSWIKKQGGEVVGTTGIPLEHPDMTLFLSKIRGALTGCRDHLLRQGQRSTSSTRATTRSDEKDKFAGDGAVACRRACPPSAKRSMGTSASTATSRYSRRRSIRPTPRRFTTRPSSGFKDVAPSNPLPDRYVQSNFEAMNCLKLGIEKSGFQGRDDTPKLIGRWRGSR